MYLIVYIQILPKNYVNQCLVVSTVILIKLALIQYKSYFEGLCLYLKREEEVYTIFEHHNI